MTTKEKLILAKEIIRIRPNLFSKTDFRKIYPFTTENIAGYIDFFDLEDKSLLTVGSSSDHVLNAALKGCSDITVLDICPFTKEYYDLKKSALLKLSREEFLSFLSSGGQLKEYWHPVLDGIEREDSFRFWKELQEEYPDTFRKRLFMADEEETKVLKVINPYLSSDASYEETRERIKVLEPTFITGDIETTKINRSFDTIFLSNIFDFIKRNRAGQPIENMISHLNEEGRIILYYLYELTRNPQECHSIKDPKNVLRYVPRDVRFIIFQGITDIAENSHMRDGIVEYQKKRHN